MSMRDNIVLSAGGLTQANNVKAATSTYNLLKVQCSIAWLTSQISVKKETTVHARNYMPTLQQSIQNR